MYNIVLHVTFHMRKAPDILYSAFNRAKYKKANK